MDDLEKLPVFIVDYHQDVLRFLLQKIGSKHLNISGNCLVHFDSHPDLQIPGNLKADEIDQNPKLICDQLSIGDWILPGCYFGIFECVYWLKMYWSNQLPDFDSQRIAIGKSKRDGLLKINYPHRYFAAENTFESNLTELENVKWFRLIVKTIDRIEDFDFELLANEKNWILDVDLDYFSTRNPFRNIYKKINLYEMLKDLYKYEKWSDECEQNLKQFGFEYRNQLNCLEKIFENLQNGQPLNLTNTNQLLSAAQLKLLEEIHKKLIDNYTAIDWELVHTAGLTCGELKSDSLPEHCSSRAQISLYMETFRGILMRLKTKPKVITISRSVSDEYTPIDDVDWIQNRLLSAFSAKFNINIIYDYLE